MPNLVDDLTLDRNKHRLTPAVSAAVEGSFGVDKSTTTRAEVKRRIDICWNIAKILRYDLGWGITRIEDHLAHYLRCELDGDDWEPDKRRCWMPSDGQP